MSPSRGISSSFCSADPADMCMCTRVRVCGHWVVYVFSFFHEVSIICINSHTPLCHVCVWATRPCESVHARAYARAVGRQQNETCIYPSGRRLQNLRLWRAPTRRAGGNGGRFGAGQGRHLALARLAPARLLVRLLVRLRPPPLRPPLSCA